ncbi:hypothetical protein HaLaN_23242 [Haematococcus lacustris]|uniref:Uncharacterized protein n=1 Tax=Haematococcus lacustris TaxID=44745 RepID=A0A699ZRJ5_HAELA|nr:hypothetical protein HaLaN_23242 [Haematococcus lacustris]
MVTQLSHSKPGPRGLLGPSSVGGGGNGAEQSGCPNMGLVIFMQVLATSCTDFGSVCCIGTCDLLRNYWQAAS